MVFTSYWRYLAIGIAAILACGTDATAESRTYASFHVSYEDFELVNANQSFVTGGGSLLELYEDAFQGLAGLGGEFMLIGEGSPFGMTMGIFYSSSDLPGSSQEVRYEISTQDSVTSGQTELLSRFAEVKFGPILRLTKMNWPFLLTLNTLFDMTYGEKVYLEDAASLLGTAGINLPPIIQVDLNLSIGYVVSMHIGVALDKDHNHYLLATVGAKKVWKVDETEVGDLSIGAHRSTASMSLSFAKAF